MELLYLLINCDDMANISQYDYVCTTIKAKPKYQAFSIVSTLFEFIVIITQR